MKVTSKKIRAEQEKELKGFRESLKQEVKLMKQEVEMQTPKSERKEELKRRKEMLERDQHRRVSTVVTHRFGRKNHSLGHHFSRFSPH